MTGAGGARGILLCITPSPAIDRTARVRHLVSGEVLRPVELVVLPGGKGVNAARAAARLGGRVMTTGVAGGHAGRWIVEALREEGLDPRFSPASAESRTTYVVVDDAGESMLVYERPAPASEQEFEAFLRLLEAELLPIAERAIVAGSVPAGVGAAGHARIVEVSRQAGRPLLVDASGAGLTAALGARPDIVKVGRIEVVEIGLVGPGASSAEAAIALVEQGARVAVVTDGTRPVVAAEGGTVWQLGVPRVAAVNAVGSGDAFDAAMSLALMDGEDLGAALVAGVAAGTANAMSLGAGMLDPDRAGQLRSRIELTSTTR